MFKGMLELKPIKIGSGELSVADITFLLEKIRENHFAVDQQSAELFLMDNGVYGNGKSDLTEAVMGYKDQITTWYNYGFTRVMNNLTDYLSEKFKKLRIVRQPMKEIIKLRYDDNLRDKEIQARLFELRLQITEEQEGWTRRQVPMQVVTEQELESLCFAIKIPTNPNFTNKTKLDISLNILEAMALECLNFDREKHHETEVFGDIVERIYRKAKVKYSFSIYDEEPSSFTNVTSANIFACQNDFHIARMLVKEEIHNPDAVRLFEIKHVLENKT